MYERQFYLGITLLRTNHFFCTQFSLQLIKLYRLEDIDLAERNEKLLRTSFYSQWWFLASGTSLIV